MRLRISFVGALVAFSTFSSAVPTWPSPIDELEDVMFLNTGYKSRGFSSHITPCSFSEFGVGRQTAAEWLRIGFHDMATTNVFFEPHGGIDGSIAFELQSGENIGAGFATSLQTFSGLYNSRLSIADLIALGVYASVRGCGGPVVPMRGGRIDATVGGPIGVPLPQNGQGTFVNQFARMGFNVQDMIQMTACGHAIGGVHAGDFPEIVAPGTAPNDFQLFDTTLEFDNKLAVQYINGPISDPLTVGISVKNTRNSDFAVFTADQNVTIKTLTDTGTFSTVCSSILQRMIETVPPSNPLSDIIAPYEVKPSGIQLTLLAGGSQIKFAGDIRVRTTSRTVASVSITYKDRTGGAGGAITTSVGGTAAGFDDAFAFYSFSSNIPAATSISSFTVTVAETGGLTTTFSNNGGGFPIQDSVIMQTPQSCLGGGKLTVFAAVRSTSTAPSLTITQKVARAAGTPVPALVNSTITMTKGVTAGPYDLYSATSDITSTSGTKFGVSNGAFADDFKDASALGATCAPFDTTSSTSSSSSTSTTSKPSTSSSSSTGTTKSSSSSSFSTSTTSKSSTSSSSSTGTTKSSSSSSSSTSTTSKSSTSSSSSTGTTKSSSTSSSISSITTSKSSTSSSSAPLSSTSSTSTSRTSSLTSTPSSKTSSSSASGPSSSKTSTSVTSSLTSTSSSKTSTSSSVAATPTLSHRPFIGPYTYQGCYTEATSTRALTGEVTFNYTGMTLELCSTSCSGYTYFGVEYGGECYCGNALSAGSTKADQGDCWFVCPGDKSEYCGAGNRLELYELPSTATTHSPSSTTTSSTSSTPTNKLYNYLGCYTEPDSVRALPAAMYADDSMTITSCNDFCGKKPYKYAGAEYARECWCADTFSTGSLLVKDSDCNMPCSGDKSIFCGAGNRLSVYIRNGTGT